MDIREYFTVVRPIAEEDGGGFIAFFPDLPGCMGDGDTPEEAVTDAYEAARAWVEVAEDLGREVPLPGSSIDAAKDQKMALMKA